MDKHNEGEFYSQLIRAGWGELYRKEQIYCGEKTLLIYLMYNKKPREVGLHIRKKLERNPVTFNYTLYVEGSTIKQWKDTDLDINDLNTVLDNFCFECSGYGTTPCTWWDEADKQCALYTEHCAKHQDTLICDNGLRVCMRCNGKGTFNNQQLDRQYLAILNKKGEVVRKYRG
jgi:hypothetical protein